jgi:RHS repeat-associated protein
MVDARQNATTYSYDHAGQLIGVFAPDGHSTLYHYDDNGRVDYMLDANGHRTDYAYDDQGRLTQTTYQDGTFTLNSYDLAGHLVNVTDQAGKQFTYQYDNNGRLVGVYNQQVGLVAGYAYDGNGNLTYVGDFQYKYTRFNYDALDRRVQKISADGSLEQFGYDLNGNMTSQQLADSPSHVNTYTYDRMNRLSTITYFDNTPSVNFTYTATGQRDTMTDARGLVKYSYDGQDRLIGITPANGSSINYMYDLVGNRTQMTTTAGSTSFVTTYGYDANNQITSIDAPSVGQITLAYDQVGMRKQINYVNANIQVDYTYNTLNRLTDIVQHSTVGGPVAPLASYHYTLDPVGNRTDALEGDGTTLHWDYDNAYRLIKETYTASSTSSANPLVNKALSQTTPTFVPPTATVMPHTAVPNTAAPKVSSQANIGIASYQVSYTYDNSGNRLTKTLNGQTTTYTYDVLNRLTADGSSFYQYDARGNLISLVPSGGGAPSTTYSYDAADRLTSATLQGGASATFAYDGDGHRIQQTVNGQTTNSLWDTQSTYGDVALETDTTGAPQVNYVLGDNELFAQVRNGAVSNYLKDGQNSIRTLVDNSGNVTDTYHYDAFGNLLNRTGTTPNTYQYTSQQFDASTGLYDLRARFYDPTQGRFLSRDTVNIDIQNPAELNPYGYTANNPINAFDPSGHQAAGESALSWNIFLLLTKILAGGFTILADSNLLGYTLFFLKTLAVVAPVVWFFNNILQIKKKESLEKRAKRLARQKELEDMLAQGDAGKATSDNNQTQNEQAAQAIENAIEELEQDLGRDLNLTDDQLNRVSDTVHREISKENFGPDVIKDIAKDLIKGLLK